MRDLVFVSLERWDAVWRRNQFLCAQWLRRFPRMRLLFVEPARDFSHAVRTLKVRDMQLPADETLPEFPGLRLFRPLKLCPNSWVPGRRLNSTLLRVQVRAAMRRAGIRNPIVWINDHFAGHLAGALGERGVVYDVTDDWSQFPSVSSAERRRIEDADRRLCARADVVVVCSEALEKSRRPLSRRLIRVPNAVDPANYVGCREPAERAASSRRFAAPVFGYVGTLHGDRLDPDLVVCLAREFSHGEVILCGPDYLKPAERDVLCAEENIRILPPVPYSEVPRLLAGFDVCLVPHKLSAFTESLNPIKLWEYLATGKPIAATPVAGFRDFAHLCHLGEGPTGFVAACRAALAEVGRLATERIRAVEPHTWERRAEDVLEVFRQQGWIGAPVRRNRLGEKRRERTAFSSGFRRVFSGPCQGCPTEGISRV